MKKNNFFKNLISKTLSVAAATVASTQLALAGDPIKATDIEGQLNNVTSNIGKIINPIIDIVLAIVGVLAVGIIAWAFAKKKKGDAGANDAIMDAAWTTLAVVAFIYIVRLFFFRS